MNKSIPKNNFDNFFKDRFKKHTISPEKELWEKINSGMNKKKIIFSLKKIQQLRIAVTVLAFALIGTITLILTDINKQNNTTIDLQEQLIPYLHAKSKSERHLNSAGKVYLLNQEQEDEDILEADNYIDDTNDANSLEIIISQETDNYIEKNNSPEVTSK